MMERGDNSGCTDNRDWKANGVSLSASSSASTLVTQDSATASSSDDEDPNAGNSAQGEASDEIVSPTLSPAPAGWDWERDGVTRVSKGAQDAWPDAATLSKWTDEMLVKGMGQLSFEWIGGVGGRPGRRRVPCRIENFCGTHKGWRDFATGPLRSAVSQLCGEEMELYKEKLNLKPAGGGGGFMPHIDTPSLRAFTQGKSWAAHTFVTAMVAIDCMTEANGCLKVARPPQGGASWSEHNPPPHAHPDPSADPDAGGRAGACEDTDKMVWEPLECAAADVFLFNGWVPHRSAANFTQLHRRAVFFTYNPRSEGSVRELYYEAAEEKRKNYAEKVQQAAAAAEAYKQQQWALEKRRMMRLMQEEEEEEEEKAD